MGELVGGGGGEGLGGGGVSPLGERHVREKMELVWVDWRLLSLFSMVR